jgi:hypothetical protein
MKTNREGFFGMSLKEEQIGTEEQIRNGTNRDGSVLLTK